MSAATHEFATRHLAAILIRRDPDEAARRLESAPEAEAIGLLAAIPARAGAELLMRFVPDLAAAVLEGLSGDRAARLVAACDPSRAALLLARLDPEPRDRVLGLLKPAAAREIRELESYPPDSAGARMDPRVTALRPDATVRDAIRRLRRLRARRVLDVFVVDEEGRLTGSIPVQDLMLAARRAPLGDLAHPPEAVPATAGREEVVAELDRHRAASLPVIDFEGRLVGVLRHRELIEGIEREATADLVTMVGASTQERALSSPWFAVRKRLPWLQINLLTAFLAAAVVGLFEGTIARFTALAVLMPVVAGQSGNTGAQALAVTMRGLALREIRLQHWWRVSAKEVTAAAVNGLVVAITTAVGVWFWSRSAGLALVIGISMVLSMTIAGLAGAAIPMVLTAIRQDPAQSSSVVLTTVTDVAGFFSFLGIAAALAALI